MKMRVSGSEALKKIDKACVEELGIPMMVLMENAALRLYEYTAKLKGNKFVIAAGTGNNGGDALALARHLSVNGKSVVIFIIGDINKGSDCFQANFNIIRNMGMDIRLVLDNSCDKVLLNSLSSNSSLITGSPINNAPITGSLLNNSPVNNSPLTGPLIDSSPFNSPPLNSSSMNSGEAGHEPGILAAQDIGKLREELQKADVVVDGIFGIGLNREVTGIYRQVIELINECSTFTVCIDIPSGMHSDSGEVLGCCIRGDVTVTFQLYKKGFLSYGSREYTGRVEVESIGIPEAILEKYGENLYITKKENIRQNIKKRNLYSHKGNFGRTLIIGGSEGLYGAPVIACQAAVRCGSGLVTAAASKEVVSVLRNNLKEAMTTDTASERFRSLMESADCIAVGPGMGTGKESRQLLKKVIEGARCPVVIDADGLNILAEEQDLMKLLKDRAFSGSRFVFTPHPGEMARLIGMQVAYVVENRLDLAKEYARQNGVIVLLKGFNTVISDGEYTYINPTGSSAMASGGMGDCLTGIIASLLSQGINPLEAAVCGAYVHGYCGGALSEKMHSVTASDIAEYLPYALKEILYL